MILVLVTALIAVCGADKLDRTYLPPASASTAGGSPGSLQTPFKTFNQGLGSFPKGSYSNDFEGVVVDASAPGTRASGADDTGLGGPRIAYGSLNSKVGEAAFTAEGAFPRVGINSGSSQVSLPNQQTYETRPERVQSTRDRLSNTVKYESDISPDRYNYAFETDNGIAAGENGIDVNGVRAQGGYSYTGDDGQVYSVTYTADEDGYRPQGDHLPTPPPIPPEILVSLEKNAQDEAAGIVDDGSYDAQKYNTGEDYTKSDNGQYNNGQPIQIGTRPQSDAVVGDSFNYQNNQGFVRPNTQFGSTTSLDGSNNVPSNGNNFGSASGAINQVPNKHTFGFGASSNEYLPPSNNFNLNRRPALNGPQGIQSDVQSGSPISSYNSNDNSGFNKNQNAGTPAIPLSQQKLQNEGSKRPQSSSPIFGKPTIIDSTLSIKDPFAKRPFGNGFTQNKQPNQKPQSFGGSFEVVSGNVYSSKNEYLPPRRQSNKPGQVNGNQRFPGTIFGLQPNQQFINSQNSNSNSPSSIAFASASRPSFQSSQQYNKPQFSLNSATNPSGNKLFGQSNQNANSRPLNLPQSSLSSDVPPVVPNFNGAPDFPFKNRPSNFLSQFPTLKPQTELTTLVESNVDGKKDNVPNPVIDGPDSPSQTSSTSLPSYGTQPSSSYQGQNGINSNKYQQSPAQPTASSTLSDQPFTPDSHSNQHFGRPVGNLPSYDRQPSSSYQGQYGINSNKFQQPSPTQPTASTLSDQAFTPHSQSTQQFGRPAGNLGSQSQPSNSPVNGQYSFSTQSPSFNQYSQQQGSDDSYYYNTPSKPFNTPTPRPQGSIFPSTAFDQSKVTQTPFGSKPTSSGTTGTFFTQSNTPAEGTNFPQPSTVESVFPTVPTQQDEPGNTFQTEFNKVTQASSSSFPSPTPTIAPGFNGNQFGQFDSRPSQPTGSLNPGSQNFNSQQSTEPQQQLGGEIYEYNKPTQTFPSQQNAVASGQVGQTPQFGNSQSNSPVSQSQTGAYRPSTQFGSTFTQQPFGQRPQNQDSQNGQQFQQNQQFQQKPGQFNRPNSQPIQGASKFPPTYNQPTPICCKQIPKGPSQTSQADEPQGTPQFNNQFRPNPELQGSDQGVKPIQSVSTFPGVGESFGGPREPPSFDKNGYHY